MKSGPGLSDVEQSYCPIGLPETENVPSAVLRSQTSVTSAASHLSVADHLIEIVVVVEPPSEDEFGAV
jgi:hypothetical protein